MNQAFTFLGMVTTQASERNKFNDAPVYSVGGYGFCPDEGIVKDVKIPIPREIVGKIRNGATLKVTVEVVPE